MLLPSPLASLLSLPPSVSLPTLVWFVLPFRSSVSRVWVSWFSRAYTVCWSLSGSHHMHSPSVSLLVWLSQSRSRRPSVLSLCTRMHSPLHHHLPPFPPPPSTHTQGVEERKTGQRDRDAKGGPCLSLKPPHHLYPKLKPRPLRPLRSRRCRQRTTHRPPRGSPGPGPRGRRRCLFEVLLVCGCWVWVVGLSCAGGLG